MSRGKREWKGYVNCSLTKEENKKVKALGADRDALWDAITSSSQEGVKYTIAWDVYNDCWVATVLGHDHVDNQGYAMSARSKDPFTALAGVAYKHTVVFGGGKWEKQTMSDLID